jgi:hypothetical protein
MTSQAVSRLDWFEPARRVTVPSNATLADIVALAEVPQWIVETGEVAINGHIVHRRHWRLVRPKDGMTVTIYPPTLHGGGGGQTKQIITIVSTIALIAGAAFISGGALLPLLGAGFAVPVRLALSLRAPPSESPGRWLFAPWRRRRWHRTTRTATSRPRRLPASPATRLRPRLPAESPRQLHVSPPFVMQPYSLLVDGVVEVYAIVGLAGYTQINSVLINGVEYSEFPEVEIETREGGAASSSALTLITRMGVEKQGEALSEFDLEDSGSTLVRLEDQSTPDNSKSEYHLFQTVSEPDEAILRLAFPAGFYKQTDSGDTNRGAIPFRIEFKQHSSSTWIKGPEIHISPLDDFAKPLRQQIVLSGTQRPARRHRAAMRASRPTATPAPAATAGRPTATFGRRARSSLPRTSVTTATASRCTFRRPRSRATSTTSGSSAASATGSTTFPRRLTSTRARRPRPTSSSITSTAQPTRSASTRRSSSARSRSRPSPASRTRTRSASRPTFA